MKQERMENGEKKLEEKGSKKEEGSEIRGKKEERIILYDVSFRCLFPLDCNMCW